MTQWNRHRQDNTIRVAEALWREAGLSRAALARRLRLDRSTVGSCVDQLIAMNLVREADRGEGGPEGGRPPVLLSLCYRYGYSIGVELSGDGVVLSANDLAGNALLRRELRHEVSGSAAAGEELAALLVSRIDDMRSAAADRGYRRLLAVAVGVSGMVDTARGEILLSRTLGISRPTGIGAPMAHALGVPVWIFNDADACAVGELEYGKRNLSSGGFRAGSVDNWTGDDGTGTGTGTGDHEAVASTTDILFVLLRYRVPHRLSDARLNAGLGIVLDGRLREAYSGGGREFRSPFAAPDSSRQFAAADRNHAGEFRAPGELEAAFADELGLSVSFLVHALDLRHVVLGGDVLTAGVNYQVFYEGIRHHVAGSTARVETQPLKLRRPVAGEQAVAFGAAAAAVRRLFRERLFPLDTDAPLVREKV